MDSTATLPTTSTETTPTETPRLSGAERRAIARDKATARLATLARDTRLQTLADKANREAAGISGRDGYLAWAADLKAEIRSALDGLTVPMTLARVSASKAGTRAACTGVVVVAGETVAIKGEATLRDWTTDPTGVTVDVRLTVGTTRTGKPVITGESVGIGSNGQRVGLRCRVSASRHVRVAASAL